MASAASQCEEAMRGVADFAGPTVSIGASEGLLAYTVKPVMLGEPRAELTLDRRNLERPLPPFAFTTDTDGVDIAVETSKPGEVPRKQGNFRRQKVGAMRFVPVAARAYGERYPRPSRFDEIVDLPLLDIGIYKQIGSLDPWNGLVANADPTRVTTIEKTSQIRDPILAGTGITLLAPYSKFHDPNIEVLEMAAPDMSVDLWLTAHEDSLREPAVRMTYDLLGSMFRTSPWFR
jgi:DNA-binding transcriptional LysR family regulator